MNWFHRKGSPRTNSSDERDVLRSPDHGALFFFGVLGRILTPLAIVGWLCYMPTPSRELPKNWDPGCPELKGTWVECELDRSKADQVMARIWPLDAGRILQIERWQGAGSPGTGLRIESRIAVLDAATGARLIETPWQPGYSHFWPGLGLSSNYFDQSTNQHKLVRWDVETLTVQQALTLPEDQWEAEIGVGGASSQAHFRPRLPVGWQMLCASPDASGKKYTTLKGMLLDEAGNLEHVAWTSDPEDELRLWPEFANGPFVATLPPDSGRTITVPLDPRSGWPDVAALRKRSGTPAWEQSLHFGHIELPGSEIYLPYQDVARFRSRFTAPLAVTDHPFPESGIRIQISYLAGQLRTQVWQVLYSGERLGGGLNNTLQLEEARLFDPELGIDCPVDGETMRALRSQAIRGWHTRDAGKPGTDPRLKLKNGAYCMVPLLCFPLPDKRLLVLHAIDDAPDPDTPAAGRLRLGLVENNQLSWLGWIEDHAHRLQMIFAASNTHLARQGDQLLLLRDGARWNGGPHGYSIPSAWIALPLPPELADLPEGPLP